MIPIVIPMHINGGNFDNSSIKILIACYLSFWVLDLILYLIRFLSYFIFKDNRIDILGNKTNILEHMFTLDVLEGIISFFANILAICLIILFAVSIILGVSIPFFMKLLGV